MNNLPKVFFLFLIAAIAVTSCSKSDDNGVDWREEQRIRDSLNNARIEALLKAQAPLLESFVVEHFPGDEAWVLDDSTGIWFKIHEPGEIGSYTYRVVPSATGGRVLAAPYVEVNYIGKLLNGEIFDATSEEETRTFRLGNLIPAWNIAFYPAVIRQDAQDFKIGGLTERGLQKGTIIELVAPSPYGYDNLAQKDKDGKTTIPADSPLHFYIEVIDISDKK